MLANNAGVAPEKRMAVPEMPITNFDRVMTINLRGPFFLTQAAAKRMIATKNALGASKFSCKVVVAKTRRYLWQKHLDEFDPDCR